MHTNITTNRGKLMREAATETCITCDAIEAAIEEEDRADRRFRAAIKAAHANGHRFHNETRRIIRVYDITPERLRVMGLDTTPYSVPRGMWETSPIG